MAHSDRPPSSGKQAADAEARAGEPKVRPGRKAARAAEAKARAEQAKKGPRGSGGGQRRPEGQPGRPKGRDEGDRRPAGAPRGRTDGPRQGGPRGSGPRDGGLRDGGPRDGGPRGPREGPPGAKDRRPEEQDEERPRKLGEPRNEHGTRTARRVRCTRCGKVDHVPGGPRDKERVLCRACLEEVMELYEVGVRNQRATRPVDCTVCGKHFDLPLTVDVDDEEVCCFDCMRGFTTWQGSVNKPETRTQPTEARRPGVRLRKSTGAASTSAPEPDVAEDADEG